MEASKLRIGTLVAANQGEPSYLPQKALAELPSVFCDGFEVFCSTIQTDKPAEALQKLASAIRGCKPKPTEFVQFIQSEVSENLFGRVFV